MEIKTQKRDQMLADFKHIGLSSLCPRKSIPRERMTKIVKITIVSGGNPKCSTVFPKNLIQNG